MSETKTSSLGRISGKYAETSHQQQVNSRIGETITGFDKAMGSSPDNQIVMDPAVLTESENDLKIAHEALKTSAAKD